MKLRSVGWMAVVAAMAGGTRAAGTGDDRCDHGGGAWVGASVDPATGAVTRRYSTPRTADHLHMRLDLFIADMNTPRMSGLQTLTLRPIGGPLGETALDARGLTIVSVTCVGRATQFEHDGRRLTIRFDPPLEAGVAAEVITAYEWTGPERGPSLGLVWTPESPAWPGRAAQLHTQGQPETNSFWFPCHDSPNERLATEVVVTVPAGFQASSNGRLAERSNRIRAVDDETGGVRELVGYETFHWAQEREHAPYLVSLVVGKFDVVDVGTSGVADGLAMPVYVPPGRGGDVAGTYGRTAAMVAFMEETLDEPYPWARYAQLVVHGFMAGGMENTSATTMYDTALFAPEELDDHDLDGLISHELAHQWFGNLITCDSWEHIWLNEGLATHMTALWLEERHGRGAYDAEILGNFDGLVEKDKAEAPAAQGMVSAVYDHPWEVFRRPANPYGKGASLMHMLRRRLGDAVFLAGLRAYVDARQGMTAETIDLRRAFEEASGESLEQFFAQWAYRPGVPRLVVTPAWDALAGTLTVDVEQTQPIDGDNPAFEFDLPIEIRTSGGGSPLRAVVEVRGRSTRATVRLDGEPTMVAVDPDLTVLAGMDVRQPAAWWLAQLASGPTPASRVLAARGLRGDASTRTLERLRRLAIDPAEPTPLRVEAVRTLAARGSEVDIRSLVTTARDAWEVRLAVTEALAPLMEREEHKGRGPMGAALGRMLAERAARDESTKVRGAAVRGLGKLGAIDHAGLVIAALATPSQHDALRQAGLAAAADMALAGALPAVDSLTRPGAESRTRAAAVAAYGKLGASVGEDVYGRLVELLDDRELRVVRAAGEALVELKDGRAAEEFARREESARGEEFAVMYRGWGKTLREKP